MTKAKERVKRDILKRRGLEPAGQGRLRPERIKMSGNKKKTLAMRLIESQLGLPIEVLLLEGKEANIAERLGIHESTVSKWRLKLGLRERQKESHVGINMGDKGGASRV